MKMKFRTVVYLSASLLFAAGPATLPAQTVWTWSDGGSNNSWNSDRNWSGASGIPDGASDTAFFDGSKSVGNKVYVTNEAGDTGVARQLQTLQITGDSSSDSWNIYAKKNEVSDSGVSVTLKNKLDTALSGGSYANLYFSLGIDGTVAWVASGDSLVLNQPLIGSGTLDGDNTSGGGMTLKADGSFSGTINTGKNTLDIDHSDALDSATINLEDDTANRLDFSGLSTVRIGAIKGSGDLNVGGGKTLEVGNSNNETFSGVISGSGAIDKTGSGVWTLSGASTFSGDLTIASGVGGIKLGHGSALANAELILNKNNGFDPNGHDPVLGGLRGTGDLNLGSSNLTINGFSSDTFSGDLSGSGGVTIQNFGSLTLSGTCTYGGPTSINSGELIIENSAAFSSLLNGLSFGGSGTLRLRNTTQEVATVSASSSGDRIALEDASILRIGDASDWTFYGSLANASSASTATLRKVGAGRLTLAGGGNYSYHGAVDVDQGILALGDGSLSNDANFWNASGSDVANFDLAVGTSLELNFPAGQAHNFSAQLTGGGSLVQSSGDNSLSGSFGAPANNSFTGGIRLEGGTLFLSELSEAGSGSITFAGGVLGIEGTAITRQSDLPGWTAEGTHDIRVDIDAAGHNFLLDTALSHSGDLEKLGAGTLILDKDNSYAYTTAITVGTLQIGNGGSTGSVAGGGIENDGALVYNRTGSLTQSGPITGPGSITVLGSVDLTLQDIANNSGTLTHSGSGSLFLETSLGGSRSLVLDGGGNMVLSGAATHTGGTTVGPGGLLRTFGASGSITGAIANEGIVHFTTSSDQTYPGVISGTGDVFQSGTGTTTWTQGQTYTGNTFISAGALQIGDGSGALPGLDSGSVLNNSKLIYSCGSSYSSTDLPVSGSGEMEKAGGGKLALLADWTHGGSTTIAAGHLVVGNGGSSGWFETPVNNEGILEFKRSDDRTFGQAISGSGKLVQSGDSVLTLTADNSYTGNTEIHSGGEIRLGNGGTSGLVSGSLQVNVGAILRLDRTDDFTLSGNIFGAGSLIKARANTVTIRGGITASGLDTTISAGTLVVGEGGPDGQLSGPVLNNGQLVLDSSGSRTHAGSHSGSGSFTKRGSGTATFSGDLGHAGGTTIEAGTLRISGTLAGPIVNHGELTYYRDDDSIWNNAVSGTGTVTKSRSGTLTVTGDWTHGGLTDISEGTLSIGNGGTSGSVSGDIRVNGTLRFNRADALGYAGALSGNGSIVKQGAGPLTLTGAGSFTGSTTVEAGTLAVNNTTGVALDGDVDLNSGTLLAGSGHLGAAVTCAGTLAPGNSAGTLTVDGALDLSGGSYVCEIGDAGHDRVDVGGTLTIATAVIDFDLLSGLSADYYIIASYGSLSGGSFASVIDLPAGYALNYAFDDGSGANKIALVSTTPPVLESMTLDAAHSSPTNADSLLFHVRFNTTVTGVDAADFDVTFTGSHGTPLVSGSGADYTVTIPNVAGDGALTLAVLSSGYTITSSVGVDLSPPSESATVTVDNTIPVITLNGDASIELSLGDAWTDPGASASDSLDGSVAVLTGGDTVDTATAGNYSITYDATDAAGNDAVQVVRTVTVSALSPLESWLEGHGLSGDDALPTADPDGDGRSNLEEFAFDGDPAVPDSGSNKVAFGIRPGQGQLQGQDYFAYIVPVRDGASFSGQQPLSATVDGIMYSVGGAYTLPDFSIGVSADALHDTSGLDALSAGWHYHGFYLDNPGSTPGPKGFLRVTISTTE